MAFGQYAHLDPHHSVTLTKQEVEANQFAADKGEYEAAQFQEVSLDKPILLFHKPANDNEKPAEPETAPDMAETSRQSFYKKLSPRLKKLLAANGDSHKQKQRRPNRAALKAAHAPKPAHAATKSVASGPLEKMVDFYGELNEINSAPLLPNIIKPLRPNHASLKLIEAVIEDMPTPKRNCAAELHGAVLIAKLLGLAA